MQICPNDKFIEIFAQKFHYFEDPFYKFFALNLLLQDTSYSLALKYSSFLLKFFSFAFYNINFWFKISKICPKISHFSQISHSRGNTGTGYKIINHIFDYGSLFTVYWLHWQLVIIWQESSLPRFQGNFEKSDYE